MARIRTIKPEICSSPQFVECSSNARLLFILSWMFCDDGGVHHDDPMRFKMEVFPGDALSSSDVRALIDELVRVGLWHRFEHDGQRFIYVSGWKHQKIEKPSYKFPGPLNDQCTVTIQRTVVEQSSNGRGTLDDQTPAESTVPKSKGKDINPPFNSPPGGETPKKANGHKGTRLPDGWILPEPCREWTVTNCPDLNINDQVERFRDYWTAQPGQKGVKTDWVATWRNWCRRSQEMNPKKKEPETPRDWI